MGPGGRDMFYGKLPIVFLAEMVSSKGDSTNGRLAAYILEHLDEIKEDSIRDLSAKTYVSISSISRFCREMGLQDFTELKELIATTSLNFEICSRAKEPERQKLDYVDAVQDSLERVRSSLDMEQLCQLARDIRRYDKVSIFGVLKAEGVAMNLQSDLMMLGKSTTTKLRFAQQVEFLNSAGEDDLIIIFSFTGIYFDYGLPRGERREKRKRPRIYFITSDPRAGENGLFHQVIWFDSRQDQASHPYQLQLVGSLIAQSYAHLLEEEKERAEEVH